ncbi:hypothetical protein Trydic_g9690 [Trypoxylus dichotomus]
MRLKFWILLLLSTFQFFWTATSGAPQRILSGETETATMTIESRFVVSAPCYRGTIRFKGRCVPVWI